MRAGTVSTSLIFMALAMGCDDGTEPVQEPDAAPDGPAVCDPATALPAAFRPIAKVATTAVALTTTDGLTSGTVEAMAGGFGMSADNPYIYVNLKTGAKVELDDLQARTSSDWDVAFKRASIRMNGGDSGTGARKVAVVQAATLAEVTAGPAASSEYQVDVFADAECKGLTTRSGEPMSVFGEWYAYEDGTNLLTPKPEIYVFERADGSRTALEVTGYYRNPTTPETRVSAVYSLQFKQLPAKQ